MTPRRLAVSHIIEAAKWTAVARGGPCALRAAPVGGEWRIALRVVEQRLATQPTLAELLESKAVVLAALEQSTEAESLLREIQQRVKAGERTVGITSQLVDEFSVARILAMLGRSDEACATLESIMNLGSGQTLAIRRNHLRYHPEWDPLRGNPRFEALLKTWESKK